MSDKVSSQNNITWFRGGVSRQDRERLHGHQGALVWFTGLSASGKSTIAHHLESRLHESGCSTYVFDGDNVRHGLCSDLGFSHQDRSENIRRIGEMGRLFFDAGIITITAFISPFRRDRRKIRSLFPEDRFLEIYVKCPIDVCATRDQKGIYEKARQGLIDEFTGISSPYEEPENPDLIIRSDQVDPETAADRIIALMKSLSII